MYLRSLFNLFLSLYTSRLVLVALGVEDYGIYNAVAGFVSMFWVVSSSLTGSVTRFITYEIGKGEKGNVQNVFSVSFTLLFILGAILLLFAESFGVWFLNSKMTIPSGRITAANYVFQTAVLSSVIGVIAAPFNSSLVAHERFGIYSALGIGETISMFSLAMVLTYVETGVDVLILYSVVRMIVAVSIHGITTTYSIKSFPETTFRLYWNRNDAGQLVSFAGWTLLGSLSGMFGGQGINIALNIFCGPAVNAARGLAFTVTNSVGIFVNNFTSAVVSQITKSYSQKDTEYFRSLVYNGSKLAFFILLLMILPLIIEADFVLGIWLKEVPEYTVVFTRLALLTAAIAMLDNILTQAQKASGIIRNYQIIISVITFANFVISYYSLKAGASPVIVYVIGVFIALCYVATSTIIASQSLGLTSGQIITKIYIPDCLVAFCASILPYLISRVMPQGWIRFLVVLGISVISVFLFAFFVGFKKVERKIFLQKVFRVLSSRYRRFRGSVSKKDRIVENLNDANLLISEFLESDKPCMIARFGRTELLTVSNYLGVKGSHRSLIKCIKGETPPWWWDEKWRGMIGELSGFFPLDDESIEAFSELILENAKHLDLLGSWVEEEKYLSSVLNTVPKVELYYLEPFFSTNPWTSSLLGKKVLVVHPFAELIESQYQNKRAFLFSNPMILPEFELITIKAVQSLGGGSNTPFPTWFDALYWMEREIDKVDFDIALIGCGAYGFPLAAYVKSLGKKAVHIGGALQLLFGIRGKRWEDPMYGVREWGLPEGAYVKLFNDFWVRPGDSFKPANANQVEGACYW